MSADSFHCRRKRELRSRESLRVPEAPFFANDTHCDLIILRTLSKWNRVLLRMLLVHPGEGSRAQTNHVFILAAADRSPTALYENA